MLKNIYVLTKFPLSFTVSLSCVFGYILAANNLDMGLLYPFLAVLFLALGVSVLNQLQEYKQDILMPRTQKRPLASGAISRSFVITLASISILLSFVFIYLSLDLFGILIFTLVIIIYNLLYTNAKKYTIYAGVYGAVLGVIPPYIGWISAGGASFDIKFIALGLFYFIWQIPHFWLLNLKYYEQYEQAGFPTITKAFGVESLERITFIWLLLTVIAGTFLLIIFEISSFIILGSIVALSIYALYSIFQLLKKKNYIYNFININIYMLFLMILLCINALYF